MAPGNPQGEGDKERAEFDAAMANGRSLFDEEKFEEALAAFTRATEVSPENAAGWQGRGVVLDRLERHEEALAAHTRVTEVAPENVAGWVGKGVALASLGRHEEALVAETRATELAPHDVLGWAWKGVALGRLGRREEALAAHTRVTELEPEYARGWLWKGRALGELGRHKEALAAFTQATELAPEDADGWRGKGETLYTVGRTSEALAALDEAVKQDPDDAAAWNVHGTTLMKLARYKEALESYEKATETGHEHVYWHGKAAALFRLESYPEAEAALQRAVDIASASKDEKSRRRGRDYERILRRLRSRDRRLLWWEWWFTEGSWIKRLTGVVVLALLAVYLVLPLITFNTDLLKSEGRLWWITTGQRWEWYVMPVVVLLLLLVSPMISKVGTGGVELQPILPPTEPLLQKIREDLQLLLEQ